MSAWFPFSSRTGLLPMVALMTALLFVAPGARSVVVDPIQPGDQATSPEGGCTLAFVFDGVGPKLGKTYFMIAGHCVEPGQSVSTPGFPNFGTVVYDDDGFRDIALIEVHADKVFAVSPAVKGHPGTPTGVTTSAGTATGDVVFFSGYGIVFNVHPITRESRVGVLILDNPNTYCVDGPILFGDSGGPVVHQATGQALGIVSHLAIECASWLGGGTVEGAIGKATADGFPIAIRTA